MNQSAIAMLQKTIELMNKDTCIELMPEMIPPLLTVRFRFLNKQLFGIYQKKVWVSHSHNLLGGHSVRIGFIFLMPFRCFISVFACNMHMTNAMILLSEFDLNINDCFCVFSHGIVKHQVYEKQLFSVWFRFIWLLVIVFELICLN
jgi:hypothetical protein